MRGECPGVCADENRHPCVVQRPLDMGSTASGEVAPQDVSQPALVWLGVFPGSEYFDKCMSLSVCTVLRIMLT